MERRLSRRTMTLTIINDGNSKKVYKEIIERTSMSSNTLNKTENSNEKVDTTDSFENTLDSKMSSGETETSQAPRMTSYQAAQVMSSAAAKSIQSDASESPIIVPASLEPIFKKAAQTYGVDEGVLIAMAKQESNFHTDSTSSSGAMGVLQLMPETAKYLGVTDAYDPEQNIMGGAKLLAGHLKNYNGNLSMALAAYSAGGGAVRKYSGIPPYLETQNHIPRVLSNYSRGYTVDDGSETVLPDANKLAETVLQYKDTTGSAFDQNTEVNERQKEDLKNLLLLSTARLKE